MLNKAQKATREYHKEFFGNAKLFEKGTWIAESEKELLSLVNKYFADKNDIQILDLGCGVGRNAIPMAKIIGPKGGKITCVDVLEIAIEKTKENAREHGVVNFIETELASVEDFKIKENFYDLIVSFSVIEHGASDDNAFFKVIEDIRTGTKDSGLNYLGITTNLQELDADTKEVLPKDIVYDATYEEAKSALEKAYVGWEIVAADKSFYTEQYVKSGRMIIWQSDFLTFIARK